MPHMYVEFIRESDESALLALASRCEHDLDVFDDFLAGEMFSNLFERQRCGPKSLKHTGVHNEETLPELRMYTIPSVTLLESLRPQVFAAIMDFTVDVLGYDLKSSGNGQAMSFGYPNRVSYSLIFHKVDDTPAPAGFAAVGLGTAAPPSSVSSWPACPADASTPSSRTPSLPAAVPASGSAPPLSSRQAGACGVSGGAGGSSRVSPCGGCGAAASSACGSARGPGTAPRHTSRR
eukprot:TRINITY_DN77930_c0_g1_i1.p1 TRINITY_DN77930_c0_g1~~TRINITY_DN77930_c0_g1_i1.p1  ORF type:complete len:244 (-),score=27.41 TRINITY_DN77930_c0_g1_i1:33-737(-)